MSTEAGPSPNFITGELDAMMRSRPEPGNAARARAVRAVAHYAHTAADCHLLLDMLGLAPQEGHADEC